MISCDPGKNCRKLAYFGCSATLLKQKLMRFFVDRKIRHLKHFDRSEFRCLELGIFPGWCLYRLSDQLANGGSFWWAWIYCIEFRLTACLEA
jgi:hypothetical protein